MMMVDIASQIACVKREIALRERVYQKWIDAGRMKKAAADKEIDGMKAALQTLLAVETWARDTARGAVADMGAIYRAARGDANS